MNNKWTEKWYSLCLEKNKRRNIKVKKKTNKGGKNESLGPFALALGYWCGLSGPMTLIRNCGRRGSASLSGSTGLQSRGEGSTISRRETQPAVHRVTHSSQYSPATGAWRASPLSIIPPGSAKSRRIRMSDHQRGNSRILDRGHSTLYRGGGKTKTKNENRNDTKSVI